MLQSLKYLLSGSLEENLGTPGLKGCTALTEKERKGISVPLGNFTGEGNGTPLQHSCLENPMDGGAWWAAVHGVTKSRTRLSDFTFTFSLSWSGPVFLPGESQGQESLVGCRLWGHTESDTTEVT